jgi:hypothetical protein
MSFYREIMDTSIDITIFCVFTLFYVIPIDTLFYAQDFPTGRFCAIL